MAAPAACLDSMESTVDWALSLCPVRAVAVDGNAFADVGGAETITSDTPCYCPGTLIATDHGDKRVEDLRSATR